MTLTIKETREVKTITLKEWDGDQWGCDFFHDAECNIVNGSEVTQDQYNEVVEYWQSEVDAHNNGEYTEQFGDYNGRELGFWYD